MSTRAIVIDDVPSINWALVGCGSLIILCALGIYWPFTSAYFTYLQLILARLAFTFLPSAVLAFLYQGVQRFRTFLIDSANAVNDLFLARGNWRPFKVFGHFQIAVAVLLCLVFFSLNQPSVFASSHSKRVAEILFVTDRSAHYERAIDGLRTISFGMDAGVPQSVSHGIATVHVAWADGFVPGRFPLGMRFRWEQDLRRTDRESVLQYAVTMDRGAFIPTLSRDIRRAPDHDVLVFVHGFRTTFSEAINSASDLSFDLKYDGVLVVFSWPSGDEVTAYDHDYENASESVKDLSSFIELLGTTRASKINVIAHSMGSRVLGKAIDLIQERGNKRTTFNNIVFAAPDVDQNTFRNFVPAIQRSGKRVTMYVSPTDEALWGSGRIHRGDRVGFQRGHYSGVDVIDTSGVDTSLLRNVGHSYLFDSVLVLSDLSALIGSDRGPERRPNLFLVPDGCWQFERR